MTLHRRWCDVYKRHLPAGLFLYSGRKYTSQNHDSRNKSAADISCWCLSISGMELQKVCTNKYIRETNQPQTSHLYMYVPNQELRSVATVLGSHYLLEFIFWDMGYTCVKYIVKSTGHNPQRWGHTTWWGKGVVYLTSPGCPTDIGLQLGKACYPCSR